MFRLGITAEVPAIQNTTRNLRISSDDKMQLLQNSLSSFNEFFCTADSTFTFGFYNFYSIYLR